MGHRLAQVIVNPAAGHGRTRQWWPRMARALKDDGVDHHVAMTSGPLEATDLTRRALEAGCQTILVVGGDGTLNEVVNGFFRDGVPIAPDARLGVLCSGTGCDFIRSLGLAPGAAAARTIAAGHTQRIDLGCATLADSHGARTQRYFINVADAGLGAEAAERVNRTSKAFGGFLSFLLGAIAAISAYTPKDVSIQIDDGPVIETSAGMVVAANGRYFAGGMFVAPPARLDDGLLDVIILHAVPKLDLLFRLLPAVYRGAHLSHPRVSWSRAQRVRISASDLVRTEVDGEPTACGDVEFGIVPRAISVIAPP